MMAERLAEIREQANNRWLHGFDPGTVRELLDHIAQLEAQRGGAVVVAESDKPTPEFLENYVEGFGPGERSAALFGWREGRADLRKSIQPVDASQVLQPGMVGVQWIAVADQLPEDGETVGFITDCSNDRWYHGRVLGGRYRAGEFGGFSVPGLTVYASHWFRFPAIPDALRSAQAGEAIRYPDDFGPGSIHAETLAKDRAQQAKGE